MSTILLTVIFLLILKTGTELWLNGLNRKEVLANKDKIPSMLNGVMDETTYKKSINYTLAKNSFSKYETIYEALILLFIITSGILPWLFNSIMSFVGNSVLGQSFTLVATGFLITLPSLPVEWIQQFRLEERFGFNKSTQTLWIADKIKGLVLTLIIGIPVVWVILKFFQEFPNSWWLWSFAFLFVFQLLMMILYPRLIMPLFNKLKPLEEGELKQSLMALANRTGFNASTIEIMDGSKRSTHSNAFFTGFGKFRRIVLFDTLVNQLNIQELEAVLAHEIGHYKKGHIPKMLAIAAISTFISFALMGWLVNAPWFYASFGFDATASIAPALLLFLILSSLVTFWVSPLMNAFSRKNEYEADAFAKDAMQSPLPLVSSLRKLSEKNLANLTPHPIFSGFYYSHPTLLERERSLLEE